MAWIRKDWTSEIVPIVNDNNVPNKDYGDKSFRTTDMISVRSCKEVQQEMLNLNGSLCPLIRRSLKDFALMTKGDKDFPCTVTGELAGKYWLRSPSDFSSLEVCYIETFGDIGSTITKSKFIGLCPSLSLRLPPKISAKNASHKIGEVKEVKSEDGRFVYHTLEFGEYPGTRASSEMQRKLESMYNGGHLRDGLECTGRLFTTNGDTCGFDFLSIQHPEFIFNGERYVRGTEYGYSFRTIRYEDGTCVDDVGAVQWIKVEPITFRILNYDKFKKGKAKILELDSDKIILSGLPFYPEEHHEFSTYYQNSMIRAFLNSAKSSDMDRNPNYLAPIEFDFTNSGFLYQAFNMTRPPIIEYIIPETETEICNYAFRGCVGIKKLTIPSHVQHIGKKAFSGCVNAQLCFKLHTVSMHEEAFDETEFKFVYLSKDGDSLVLSPFEDATLDNGYLKYEYNSRIVRNLFNNNYKQNLIKITKWKQEGAVKFIPPDYTLKIFPSSQIHNYFVNNNHKRWGELVKTLGFDKTYSVNKEYALVGLMKIYYAIGGFSANQGECEKAYNYVLKCVSSDSLNCESFLDIQLTGPYNPTFAKFFMKYYHNDPCFMYFRPRSRGELFGSDTRKDGLCMAHNAFNAIMKAYPNMVVTGNEKRSLLTPEFVIQHLYMVEYDNVDKGNELLARIVGKYGYNKIQFEHIQEVYNEAKTIKDIFVLSADKAKGENGITFRILEKDDPIGFVLGDITNCCQHIGGAAEECVDDGYKNPYAGFLVFEEFELDEKGKPTGETRILGQAYVWYDPVTKTVCYDNIEIPTKVLNELWHGNKQGEGLSSKALMDSVVESADAIMLAMNRKGIRVDKVTTGRGRNDLNSELNSRFGAPEIDENKLAKHRSYDGYSDAENAQYTIRTYDQTTKEYASKINALSDEINKDLNIIEENIKSDSIDKR